MNLIEAQRALSKLDDALVGSVATDNFFELRITGSSVEIWVGGDADRRLFLGADGSELDEATARTLRVVELTLSWAVPRRTEDKVSVLGVNA